MFVNQGDWEMHKEFVNFFALIPLVMFILSFLGKIQGRYRWIPLVWLIMIAVQFLAVKLIASAGTIAALHPVIAVLLFWRSVSILQSKLPKL